MTDLKNSLYQFANNKKVCGIIFFILSAVMIAAVIFLRKYPYISCLVYYLAPAWHFATEAIAKCTKREIEENKIYTILLADSSLLVMTAITLGAIVGMLVLPQIPIAFVANVAIVIVFIVLAVKISKHFKKKIKKEELK